MVVLFENSSASGLLHVYSVCLLLSSNIISWWVVTGNIIHGVVVLVRGHTVHKIGGEMMMGSSI